MYKWIERFEAEGWDGLKDQSRAPHEHPNAVKADIERQLLELKEAKPLWGARGLHNKTDGTNECIGP